MNQISFPVTNFISQKTSFINQTKFVINFNFDYFLVEDEQQWQYKRGEGIELGTYRPPIGPY